MLKMNKKGFTLVELLVVLAILGLLAGIGIPMYMDTLKRSRQAADVALVAVVQSAVDAFLSETGAAVSVLQKSTTDDELVIEKADTKQANSLLTGTPLDLKDFLEGKELPAKFKSVGSLAGGNWHITSNGKVYVSVTVDGAIITIPSPQPD